MKAGATTLGQTVLLKPGLKKIEKGIHKVTIPELYYKVSLDLTNKRAIGFVMPNKECEYPVMKYACSIDSVERLTGIDFFSACRMKRKIKLKVKLTLTNGWEKGKPEKRYH